MSTKVSVLIPTYNRAYIIHEALESALCQTYRDLEVLVIDDGSSDNTQEIVQSLHEPRIRYLRHDYNRGCSAAYNTGIAAATGQLVAFLDSDDIWEPEYVESQVAFFSRHVNADVVFTDTVIREAAATIPSLIGLMRAFPRLLKTHPGGEDYVLSHHEIHRCLLEEVPIKPSACVVRRAVFDRAGGFDEACPSGTDWDLFLRFSHFACFGYLARPLVIQRRTLDATHQKFREEDKLFLIRVLAREKEQLQHDPEGLLAVNRGIALHYNSLAWTYLERGEGARALSVYLRGFLETRRPMLLRKLASGVMRIVARNFRRTTVPDHRLQAAMASRPRSPIPVSSWTWKNRCEEVETRVQK